VSLPAQHVNYITVAGAGFRVALYNAYVMYSARFSIHFSVSLALTITAQMLVVAPPVFLPFFAPFWGLHGLVAIACLMTAALLWLGLWADWKADILYVIAFLLFIGMAFFYFGGRDWLGGAIFVVMALAQVWVLYPPRIQLRWALNGSLLLAGALNLGVGIGLLAIPTALSAPMYLILLPAKNWLAAGFVLSAVFGVLGQMPANRAAMRFLYVLSLPWLVWLIVFALHFALHQVIAALTVLAAILGMHVQVPPVTLPRWVTHFLHRAVAVGLVLLLGVALILWQADARLLAQAAFLVRQIVLMVLVFFAAFMTYTQIVVIAGATQKQSEPDKLPDVFTLALNDIALENQQTQIARSLAAQKRRVDMLEQLNALKMQLYTTLDTPVAAQLVVNTVERAFQCALVSVFVLDDERDELEFLAVAGKMAYTVPPSYRQSADVGLMGRCVRTRRPQFANDTSLEPDYLGLEHQTFRSEIVIPVIVHASVKGVLVVDFETVGAFDQSDVAALEAIGVDLAKAWQNSLFNQRMVEVIQAGVTLSGALDLETALRQGASLTHQILAAEYVFLAALDAERELHKTTSAGYAPLLQEFLNRNPSENPLVASILQSARPTRLRDFHSRFPDINIQNSRLRPFLGIPLSARGLNLGVLIAFGKRGAPVFDDHDETFMALLAAQISAALETAWLYQQARGSLETVTHLHQLSTRIMQSDMLLEAITAIAETAYRLGDASEAGIMLFDARGNVQAEVKVDQLGAYTGSVHPVQAIEEARQRGQSVLVATKPGSARVCLPIVTPHRAYGAVWFEIPELRWNNARYVANLEMLANQSAVALERSMLLEETRLQARALEAAYRELEVTYDQTLAALSSALDARDRETEGHSRRVGWLACKLAEEMQLPPDQMKALQRGALLHDIGKIGVSDTILLKPGPLTDEEWLAMRRHPDVGGDIIAGIPFLRDGMQVVRYHHERWNGSGYPHGLKGEAIPLLARIFAVADAFDALTSTRPYRESISHDEALQYMQENANILFDEQVVDVLEKILNTDLLRQAWKQ
jgi:HD-GYP domain-containing protein (c-di-GMP phosphodiesterase class II)/putative methionine-R-sulfoxide reductase with GAF domain